MIFDGQISKDSRRLIQQILTDRIKNKRFISK